MPPDDAPYDIAVHVNVISVSSELTTSITGGSIANGIVSIIAPAGSMFISEKSPGPFPFVAQTLQLMIVPTN